MRRTACPASVRNEVGCHSPMRAVTSGFGGQARPRRPRRPGPTASGRPRGRPRRPGRAIARGAARGLNVLQPGQPEDQRAEEEEPCRFAQTIDDQRISHSRVGARAGPRRGSSTSAKQAIPNSCGRRPMAGARLRRRRASRSAARRALQPATARDDEEGAKIETGQAPARRRTSPVQPATRRPRRSRPGRPIAGRPRQPCGRERPRVDGRQCPRGRGSRAGAQLVGEVDRSTAAQ